MRVNNWNKPRKWGCNYCKTVHRTTFYFPLRQADKLAPARRATRPICSRMRFTKTGRSENHKNHHRDIKTVPFNKVPLLPTLNEGVIYRLRLGLKSCALSHALPLPPCRVNWLLFTIIFLLFISLSQQLQSILQPCSRRRSVRSNPTRACAYGNRPPVCWATGKTF